MFKQMITFAAVAGLVFALAAGTAQAADGTWNVDANGTWSTAADPPWLARTVADGSGSTANFNTLDITADRTVSLDSARTIGNLIFGDTNTSTAAGWILDNNGNAANILTLAGGTPTITVNALAPYDAYAPKSANISGVIAGSSGLTKAGAGRLKLTGVNTYAGGTVVDGGTLAIINNNNCGAVPGSPDAANITLNNGATLNCTALTDVYNAGNTVDLGANRGITLGAGIQTIVQNHRGVTVNIRGVISGSGGVDFKNLTPSGVDGGGGSRTHVYGANTYTGDTTITFLGIKDPGVWLHNSLALQNSTLDYNTNAGGSDMIWFSGHSSYTLGGLKGNKTLNLSPQGNTARNLKIGNNNQDTTFTGVIRSSDDPNAGITKIGTGTLTLTGNSTYTGDTVIEDGTLALGGIGVLDSMMATSGLLDFASLTSVMKILGSNKVAEVNAYITAGQLVPMRWTESGLG